MQSVASAPYLRLRESRLWLSIWLHPRQTIRRILDNDPTYRVKTLAALAGIGTTLFQGTDQFAQDGLSLGEVLIILALSLTFGALGGIVALYFRAWYLRITSGWFGGTADGYELRAVVAWSAIPNILSACGLWLPYVLVYTALVQGPESAPYVPLLSMLLIDIWLLQLLFIGWSVVLEIAGVAEANHFSNWRAVGAVLAPLLIIVAIFFPCILMTYLAR